MRAVLVSTFVLLLVFVASGAPSGASWSTDLDAARALALRDERLLVVHVADPSLPLAERMMRETFATRAVRGALAEARAVLVRVDPARFHASDLASDTPLALGTLAFSSTGELLGRCAGYANARRMEAFLRLLDANRHATDPIRMSLAAIELGVPSRARAGIATLRRAGHTRTADDLEARLLLARGDVGAARELLGTAAPLPFTAALLAFAERDVRGTLEALDALADEESAGGLSPAAQLLQGRAQHELGRDREALATWNGVVRRFPRSMSAVEAALWIEHVLTPDHHPAGATGKP